MERQPVSKLAEIQNRDAVLGSLIDKRHAMLQSAPWNITREDPDIEAAARNHARILVEVTIPGSISRLEQRRMDLRAERIAYIQEHAPELISQAQAFKSDLAQERRTVERLSRDLQRGFTTQEVIDRRTAALQALESRRETDLELQAGFELLSQERQAEEAVSIEDKPGIEAKVDFPKNIKILPGLGDFTTGDQIRRVGPSETVNSKLKDIKDIDESQLTPEQKQLLEDVEFINQLTSRSAYQDVYSPQELRGLVERVKGMIGEPSTPQFSIEFQRMTLGIVKESEDLRRVRSNSLKTAFERINSENPQSLQLDDMIKFAQIASNHIVSTGQIQEYRIIAAPITTPPEIIQASLDIAGREIYRKKIITPEQANSETFKKNRGLIHKWHEEVKADLENLLNLDLVEVSSAVYQILSLINEMDEVEVGNARDILNQAQIARNVYSLNHFLSKLRKRGVVQEIFEKKEVEIVEPSVDGAKAETAEVLPGDIIPSLLPQLDHITSMHEHKYNLDNTVGRKAQEAQVVEPENRTPEQQQLLEDIAILSQFTTSETYRNVYSPAELRSLVDKLKTLRELKQYKTLDFNNDFLDSLREQILNTVSPEWRRKREQLKRQDWTYLNKIAGEALNYLSHGQEKFSIEQLGYLLSVEDPDSDHRLSNVYRFIATNHALDVIGQRSIRADRARQETFVANCQVVNDWYAEVSQSLSGLPDDPQVRRLVYQLEEMVETMNIRLEGKQSTGFNKDYRLNPAGAISLQKRIGYTVEKLKARVSALVLGEVDEDKIVPLE